MKHAITLSAVALLVLLAGCSGGGGAPDEATATAVEEDLFKQWGPSEMPDREEQPLEFLHWRVDELFRNSDANEDGRLDFEEFSGERENFDRIDLDGDGFVTKKEIIDDMVPLLESTGELN